MLFYLRLCGKYASIGSQRFAPIKDMLRFFRAQHNLPAIL